MVDRRILGFVGLLFLFLFTACTAPGPVQPTIDFPTPVPTDLPETATPGLTGACTLLTPADIHDVLGFDAVQASSSPLSCGYAEGGRTVLLTLLGQSVWDNYNESFSASDTGQSLAIGDRSLYFPATLEGLVMTQRAEEIYLLSGVGSREAATELMQRILQRNAAEEGG